MGKWIKLRTIRLVLLGLLNVTYGLSVTTDNERISSTSNNGRPEKGILKRNVLYNYVTDRPRVPFAGFHRSSGSPRNSIVSLEAQKQHLALLMKYRQYLTKLYSKRRSDISSPILQGDMPDYKDKEYESSPELLTSNQIRDYESVDVNKKYGPRMTGLDYYTATRDALPADPVILPHQDYHSPIAGNLGPFNGYSQYYPARSDDVLRPFLSKEDSDVERLIEIEKLRELEELRGT